MSHIANGLGPRDELSGLFEAYRQACGEPEASAGFMPGLWERIESRRSFTLSIRRMSRGLVTAAAAVCLLMAIYFVTPGAATSPYYTASYLDVLSEDHAPDTLPYIETSYQDTENYQ